MSRRGIFIAIEGSDGSGKGTQFKRLVSRLVDEGYEVATYDFPQYGKGSSYFVERYLNGEYGEANQLGSYTPSYFYALDRFNEAESIRNDIGDGKVVIANRFAGSNMAHQGGKLESRAERSQFFKWADRLEFEILGIPKPDLNLVLLVDAEVAQRLVDNKQARSYTELKRDIHEADLKHLTNAVETYRQLCSVFPDSFVAINCVESGELMSIDNIHQNIWERIKPMLGKKSKSKSKENKLIDQVDGRKQLTEAGKDWISRAVTDVDGDVYAFNSEMNQVTVAAAMARLSRNPNDMRVILADEFSGDIDDAEGLLKRVITAYGDDSVQQLTGLHLVVENASNLLTKKLEWGRLAAYLEQSTRYIYFDQPNAHGQYRYHTPNDLAPEHSTDYRQTMDEIFKTYSSVVQQLTDYVRLHSTETKRDGAWKAATRAQACDAARPLLPVATTSTVGIYASGQALESMIMRLRADELPEAKQAGQAILDQSRQVLSTFLERADKPSRGGATSHYLLQTRRASQAQADKLSGMSVDIEPVRLVDVSMRNELDVVPYILAEYSDKSIAEIEAQIADWSLGERLAVLDDYIGERLNRRHKPGRALEHIHYTWEIICDYGIFRDLQRHRMVDGLTWQELTPRYGFETPQLVVDAGLEDEFESCFDLSFELYNRLQKQGYGPTAQYATLMGHKLRWKIGYNARQAFHFHELRTTPQGHPGYRKLVNQIHDRLAEVHPNIAAAMRFVNKDEDEELTRLAAERYTQSKLANLD